MEREVRERFERIEANLEQLTVSHVDLEAAQKNLTALLARITRESDERMKALDERLNILIGIVERHITDK